MACIRNIKSLTKAFKKGALLSILNIFLDVFETKTAEPIKKQ